MLKEKIKELCSKNGTTVQKLEDALGIGNGVISRWDKSSPKAENLEKIADYFGVSVDYLLGRTESPTDEEIMALFPNGKFDFQLFSQSGPLPPDGEYIQRAAALFAKMDDEDKKIALAQMEALANRNKG